LHVAIDRKRDYIMRLLLSDARLNIASEVDPAGEAPLHIAARAGNCKAVSLLSCDPRIDFNQKDANGRTALHHTAMFGHLETTKLLLLDPRCDPGLRDSLGYTPLHLSFLYGEDSVTWLLLKLTLPANDGEEIVPPESLESESCDVIVRYLMAQQDFSFDHLRALREAILAPKDSVPGRPVESLPFMLSYDWGGDDLGELGVE
jgi:ankyrin repeat protein